MIAIAAAEKRQNMLDQSGQGPMSPLRAHREHDNNSDLRIPAEELFEVPADK